MAPVKISNKMWKLVLILVNFEKGIWQDDVVDAVHFGICLELWIDVKKHLKDSTHTVSKKALFNGNDEFSFV